MWGQVTTTLAEYGTNEVAWSASNAEDWTKSSNYMTKTLITEGLMGKNKNGSEYLRKTIVPSSNVILNISAEFNLFSNTGRNIDVSVDNAHGSFFRFGNIYIIQNSQNQKSYYSLSNCKSTGYTYTEFAYSATHRPANTGTNETSFTDETYQTLVKAAPNYYVEMEINTATNTLTSFKVYPSSAKASTLVDLSNQPLSNADYTTIEIGFLKGNGMGFSSLELLKSLKVTQTTQPVSVVDYTINYKLGEETVKTVASSSTVGATITADAAIDGTEEGYVGNHYLITAAEAPSMTLVADAASNVLNVTVRAPYTATLNVTKTIGGVAQTPVVTNLTETDAKVCSWNYTYPLYVQKDGVYYVADATASFGESGNFTDGQIINKTVAYTNPDYSVVYYGEPNEVAGTNTSYSNGNVGYIKGGVVYSSNDVIRLGQLAAGTYRLITNVTGDAGRNVVVGDYTAGTESFPTALVTITTTGAKDETFTVDGTQLICISGKDQGSGKFNQSSTLDYILVKASTQKTTLDNSGYATLASAYPLNVASASMTASTGSATAYKAAIDGTVAKFTELNQTIPANTGILLKGDAGATVTIPVVASGTAVDGNAFLVNTTGATFDAEASYYYFAMKKNAATLTFNAFAPGTLAFPANKAYLKVATSNFSGGAPALTFDFGEGETTGINAVKGAEFKVNGEYYNLAGQRVAQPTKGLYIVNGRKVVIK